MEESIVKVEHLSHRYSIQWAIRDINIEITRNGIYGVLGSNGYQFAGESGRGQKAFGVLAAETAPTHGFNGRGISGTLCQYAPNSPS